MVGGLGAILVFGLVGCDNTNQQNQSNGTISNASQQQGAFVIIEQATNGSYKIADEFPASKTTIVLRSPDGNERILSQEEIDKLVKEEEAKIDAGTSSLTNPELSSGGMGLGGVLLSSIAGAMIGSWLGNKLFNKTYSKSQSSFNKPAGTTNTSGASKKSGFFGGKSSNVGSSNSSTMGG